MKTEQYIVTLERPCNVGVRELAAYIKEAVGTWGGVFRPPGAYDEYDEGDPLFGGVECEVWKMRKLKTTKE